MVGSESSCEHTSRIQLKNIPILCQGHCKIKDPERVERIINEFLEGGPERLQLVSDFDHTITKQRNADGRPVLTSFGVFNACKSLPSSYVEEAHMLFQKYRPIEIDPKIPLQDKMEYMREWWTLTGNLITGFPLEQQEIDEVAASLKGCLRDNSHEMFELLHRLNIPVLVFSAGLGNSVESVLRQENVLLPNVKIVSNFLRYKDGLLNGFEQTMIHTFNKNETVLEGSEYYDLVHTRDHIIVMGDHIGDAGMAEGVPASSHIIKIGFLFDHIEENIDTYMNTFDIVLVDDQSMDVPNTILTLIEEEQKKSLKTTTV